MRGLFALLGSFVVKWHLIIIIAVLGLVALAVFGASRIEMETGLETMISTDTREYQDYARFSEDFGANVMVVMVRDKGENGGEAGGLERLLNDDNTAAIQRLTSDLESAREDFEINGEPAIVTAISPTVYLQQQLERQTRAGMFPPDTTLADLSVEQRINLVTDPATGNIGEQFRQVIPGEHHVLISVILKGDIDSATLEEIVQIVREAVDTARYSAGVEPVVTGQPALMDEVNDMMMETTGQMLLLAVALLFLILALIFKVHGVFPWRWLPLLVIIIGVTYTFGLMGATGVPLTMVSMAVFPVMIGLGIDYGIQFHNRYDEESLRDLGMGQAVINAVTYIGPAVAIALIAACLGFVALFFSPVPMIQDFGLMLIIGVLASYFVAAFPLTSILYWRDRRKRGQPAKPVTGGQGKTKDQTGIVEKGLQRISSKVIRNPILIVPVALALTIGGLAIDSRIGVVTDESTFISQDLEIIEELKELQRLSERNSSFNLLIEAESPDVMLNPGTLEWMRAIGQEIYERRDEVMTEKIVEDSGEEGPVITEAQSIADLIWAANVGAPESTEQVKAILADAEKIPPSTAKNLINADYTACNLQINLRYADDDKLKQVKENIIEDALASSPPPEGVKATVTGMPVVGLKVVEAITSGRSEMTVIGIGFIFGALLLLFRLRVVRAVLATLPVVLIIGWSNLAMFVLGIDFTPLTATFGALIMAIGVEYTILLMTRYYEERGNNQRPVAAMTTAMTKIGRGITVSAFTTIGGFAALLIAVDFPIVVDFGIVTMIDVFFALFASLMVLPSLVVFFDKQAEKRGLNWLR